MKKTLIITAFASLVFAACSSESKNAATTDSVTVDTAITSVDSTVIAVDSAATDSATKAHGHAH